MAKRWILPVCLAALLLAESPAVALPARADGEAALMQRLLDDSNKAEGATAAKTKAAAPRNAPRQALRLTPDRSEIIRLQEDAASVVVTNPAHAQVMMETPRLLLVMPRQPGSTSLFVLDAQGKTILERDILVSASTQPYVRIRKACAANDQSCQANSYYYCPDGCYEVTTVPGDQANNAPPAIEGGTPTLDTGAQAQGGLNAAPQNGTDDAPAMDGASGLNTDTAPVPQ